MDLFSPEGLCEFENVAFINVQAQVVLLLTYLVVIFNFSLRRMVFGYAYPAYECFKTVEMNKPDIQELRFWCQYWYMAAFSLSIS